NPLFACPVLPKKKRGHSSFCRYKCSKRSYGAFSSNFLPVTIQNVPFTLLKISVLSLSRGCPLGSSSRTARHHSVMSWSNPCLRITDIPIWRANGSLIGCPTSAQPCVPWQE